ncbi:HNH endonuclease [Ramlibacter pallidus]|uniref:HNH endonuclease n=1 Tax=Ramlibacter pallidus TaxID=2780087 RepID=A0ABR9S1X9_9BURK|nr:HNH endonuclease [Ramlibacter pallidus]MBE7367521.1 HNH endonuclease [Ramlibacter pallidus]
MPSVPSDSELRAAAFEQVRRLQVTRDQITADDLKVGFFHNGTRYPLINPQRGIFKPQQMEALLSIRTVFPRAGNRVWYDDQRQVHRQIYNGEETVDYAFMGTDPRAAENRWLKAAMEQRTPIIYFLGTAPGRYEALQPAFIVDWDAQHARAKVAFSDGPPTSASAPTESLERRYALRLVKQRLHQSTFREAVIDAYKSRCALSGVPEPILLDAAHIIEDKNEKLGQPVVQNGIPLSKIHHAAFDAHLLGIDPDFRIHVAKRLLLQKDGPILEALKDLDGALLRLPPRAADRPDRDRLEQRFGLFKALG